MPVALHAEQPRAGQVAGHGHGALVWGLRIDGVVDEQDRLSGAPVPRPAVALGGSGQPTGARLVVPDLKPADVASVGLVSF
jgi:hypothetical protein